MFAAIENGAQYVLSLDAAGLFALFWLTVIFDLPRTIFMSIAALVIPFRAPPTAADGKTRVSVIIAGHNEAGSIERCVRSMHEQSRPPDEIIVISDGSTDDMPAVIRDLQRRGLIDQAHSTQLRGGKAAAMNLAKRWVTGDIVINVDCDCSFHRHAIKNILAPFGDPAIGSVSGNILVRNEKASLISSFQAIEYVISMSLAKQAQALFDQVTCVSGAFSAFRRSALTDVSGVDAGSGEDFDLTLRLRKAGWKIGFAPRAICYTDVPATVRALVKQRFRWERDALRLRYRKHGDLMNPFSDTFRLSELFHEFEFIVFHVFAAAALPFYLIWLFATYGDAAHLILIAVQLGSMMLEGAVFLLAAMSTPDARIRCLIPFVLAFGLYQGVFMRFVRLAAYLDEWLFNASVRDNYVPAKVQILRRW